MNPKLAHPGKRFQGQFIDGLIAMFILGTSVFLFRSTGINNDIASYIPMILAGGYFLFSDALPNGQSLGKKLLRVSVVDKESGNYCSVLQSFLRNFLTPIFGLFDAVLIFGKSRQRLGDMLAKTIVIESKP